MDFRLASRRAPAFAGDFHRIAVRLPAVAGRLLLATETALSASVIVELYTWHWGIESLFHNLKRWWDITNLLQKKRTALKTWMQIRSTAWTQAQLLALAVDEAFSLREVALGETVTP